MAGVYRQNLNNGHLNVGKIWLEDTMKVLTFNIIRSKIDCKFIQLKYRDKM